MVLILIVVLNHRLPPHQRMTDSQIRALLISHPHGDGLQSITVHNQELILACVGLTYKLLTQLSQSLASKVTVIESALACTALSIVCFSVTMSLFAG